MLKIHGIGGYEEVGKNMTAVETGDDDAFLFDAGLYLPAIVGVQEREKVPTESGMRAIGALPDDIYLEKKGIRQKVKSILISHAHLDHVGGAPYIGPRYKADIVGTPYTLEVLKSLLNGKERLPNRLVNVNPNGIYTIKGKKENYKVEFINITHSTLQCAMVAVHTKSGVVLYTNDYKFDNTPILGDKPNYKRLRELSKIGIKALVADCLYAPDDRKTPSEKIARGLLEDVMFTTDNSRSGMLVTTFSSHVARLKSIAEFGARLGRKVIFCGRGLNKYVNAAIKINMAPFKNTVQMAYSQKHMEKLLQKANNEKRRYMVVCTGHQGEPGSVLDRISKGQLPYKISPDDHIIFSSRTIPTPVNEASKAELEKRLRKNHPRIFDNVHVSGHGGREDLRDLIRLTNPEHIFPSHGDLPKLEAGINLAVEMGYRKDYNAHILSNGKEVKLV